MYSHDIPKMLLNIQEEGEGERTENANAKLTRRVKGGDGGVGGQEWVEPK